MTPEVLIAGAGPVGLTVAAELARFRIPVRVIDRAAQRSDKSKALVVWPRTLEHFDSMGCAAGFVTAGLKVTSANIASGSEHIAHVNLNEVASPHPYALLIPQSETERLLEEHLDSFGVTVERGVELIGFGNRQQVNATLRRADGSEEQVSAPWLVACDGAHSTVRHLLGLPFVGDTLASDWLLADVHLTGVPNADSVNLFWHANGVLAIFPISRERVRVVADLGPTDRNHPRTSDPTLEEVQAILNQRGPGAITASDPVWLSLFRINERKVQNYRSGRIFLAGDAAHVHSPAGGQGMNTGIQDACNLAWKLALVIRGVCHEEPLLSSYNGERSPIGERVIKGTGRATQVATMHGEFKQSLRNHLASLVFGLSFVRHAVAEMVTELDIAYPDSPLHVGDLHLSGGPRPGQRAPVLPGQTPVSSGPTPRFTVFTDSAASGSQLASRYPDLVDPLVRPAFEPGGLWLVRPDGYVAAAASSADWEAAAGVLNRIAISSQSNATAVTPR